MGGKANSNVTAKWRQVTVGLMRGEGDADEEATIRSGLDLARTVQCSWYRRLTQRQLPRYEPDALTAPTSALQWETLEPARCRHATHLL